VARSSCKSKGTNWGRSSESSKDCEGQELGELKELHVSGGQDFCNRSSTVNLYVFCGPVFVHTRGKARGSYSIVNTLLSRDCIFPSACATPRSDFT